MVDCLVDEEGSCRAVSLIAGQVKPCPNRLAVGKLAGKTVCWDVKAASSIVWALEWI